VLEGIDVDDYFLEKIADHEERGRNFKNWKFRVLGYKDLLAQLERGQGLDFISRTQRLKTMQELIGKG